MKDLHFLEEVAISNDLQFLQNEVNSKVNKEDLKVKV